MNDNAYDIGDLLEIVVFFTNQAGAPADPTAITFIQRDPTGAEVTMDETDATNPNVGEWRWMMPAPFDRAGVWRWRAEATDGIVAAVERSERVRPSLFS